MLTASQPTVAKKRLLGRLRNRVCYPQIMAASKAFGCHRTHLYRVLNGQFPDHHNLRERYAAFVASTHTGK